MTICPRCGHVHAGYVTCPPSTWNIQQKADVLPWLAARYGRRH